MKEISTSALQKNLKAGKKHLFLVDVRRPDEFKKWHIDGSINIPVAILHSHMKTLPKQKEIITICLKGVRSSDASSLLRKHGFNSYSLAGGITAWNSVYDVVEIKTNSSLRVFQFKRMSKGCISYLISSDNKGMVIDPATDINLILEEASKHSLKIIGVLDTHLHADHVSGSRLLVQQEKIPYYAPKEVEVEERRIISHGDALPIGNSALSIMASPGHTKGSLSLSIDSLLFTWHTLFVDSVGRPDLEEHNRENARTLFSTIQKIIRFTEDTKILPSHFSQQSTFSWEGAIESSIKTVKDVKAISMPKEKFIDWITQTNTPKPQNFQIIRAINKGNKELSLPEIRTLEAGPSECSISS